MWRIYLILLSCLLTSCIKQLTYMPRERLSASYHWKENGFATVDQMMDIITARALLTPGKTVQDITEPISGKMPIGVGAISEEKSSDGIQFVSVAYYDGNLPRHTIYYETRGVKKEENKTLVWKQSQCVKDNKGALKMFYTKASCNNWPEAAFNEARMYYQQNKDKMEFVPLTQP